MPSRIRKTVPISGLYYHHEHRSRKGRKPLKTSDKWKDLKVKIEQTKIKELAEE